MIFHSINFQIDYSQKDSCYGYRMNQFNHAVVPWTIIFDFVFKYDIRYEILLVICEGLCEHFRD